MPSTDYRYLRSFFTTGQIRRGIGITVVAAALGAIFYTQANVMSLLFAGFAVDMHVSKPLMSVLVATLPLSWVAGIVMAYLIQRTGRRYEFFTWGLVAARLLWLPLVLIPFIIPAEYYALRMSTLFGLLLLSSVLGTAGDNAWGSWIGDLVPSTVLGRYFGFRQVFTVSAAIVTGVVIGVCLDNSAGTGRYVWVMAVLLAFGLIDVLLFRWVPHPPMQPREDKHTLWEMLKIPLGDARYRRVIVFFATWNFTSGLLAPYVGYFMRHPDYMAMDYTTGFVYGAIAGGCQVVTAYFWGKLADRWSAKKVLLISFLMGFTPPFYYLFATPQTTWPILAAFCVGNLAWGGIFVVNIQMVIGLAPAKDRAMYLACQAAVIGVVLAASYLAAGFIVKKMLEWGPVHWPVGPWTWKELHILFLICGLARLACLWPLRGLDEPKHPLDVTET